eukprot:1336741-Alexandrium_andersonii.AAC.1
MCIRDSRPPGPPTPPPKKKRPRYTLEALFGRVRGAVAPPGRSGGPRGSNPPGERGKCAGSATTL